MGKIDKLTIKFKDEVKNNWTIDGEKLKEQKKEYTITVDKNFNMLLPKKNLDKLFTK